MRVCSSLSLSLFRFDFFVFLSFDGSETLVKINIIRFPLHPTNALLFFPLVLQFSHSSPGMFGTGSRLHFPRSDPPPPPPHHLYPKAQYALSLSLSFRSPSSFFVTLFCHLSFTSQNIHYITPITRHCHANILPSTGQKNIAQPKKF